MNLVNNTIPKHHFICIYLRGEVTWQNWRTTDSSPLCQERNDFSISYEWFVSWHDWEKLVALQSCQVTTAHILSYLLEKQIFSVVVCIWNVQKTSRNIHHDNLKRQNNSLIIIWTLILLPYLRTVFLPGESIQSKPYWRRRAHCFTMAFHTLYMEAPVLAIHLQWSDKFFSA